MPELAIAFIVFSSLALTLFCFHQIWVHFEDSRLSKPLATALIFFLCLGVFNAIAWTISQRNYTQLETRNGVINAALEKNQGDCIQKNNILLCYRVLAQD